MVSELGLQAPRAVRIGVLSDTHIPTQLPALPPALTARLQSVDLILHAGDIVTLDVLTALGDICEVRAVYGNADDPRVRAALPDRRLLTIAGRRIGLIHGNRSPKVEARYTGPGDTYDSPAMTSFYRYLTQILPDAEVIVFGHFHVPVIRMWEGRLLLNPGAVAHKYHPTFALLHVGPGVLRAEIVDLQTGAVPAR